MIIISCHIMMIILWSSLWVHFEYISGSFWEDFENILGSCPVQNSSWKLSESIVRVRSRFSGFDADHFGGFWKPLGEVFRHVLVSFVDINFTMDFNMILKWFLMDFSTLWTSKNEQKARNVVQKSNFRVYCDRMRMRMDFRWIMRSFRSCFWPSIGLRKRLGRQLL